VAAADELSIGLSGAFRHPALSRAQQLLGVGGGVSLGDAWPAIVEPAIDEPEEHLLADHELEDDEPEEYLLAEDELEDDEPEKYLRAEDEPEEDDLAEDIAPAPTPVPAPAPEPRRTGDWLRVRAIHLSGVANLPSSRQVELRLSSAGLDIIRTEGSIFGRMGWSEIEDLQVAPPRGRLRRRRARLVLRTQHGEALFEVPSLSSEQLRRQLEPLASNLRRE